MRAMTAIRVFLVMTGWISSEATDGFAGCKSCPPKHENVRPNPGIGKLSAPGDDPKKAFSRGQRPRYAPVFIFCQWAGHGMNPRGILRSGFSYFWSRISGFQAGDRLLVPELVITSKGIWLEDAQVNQEGVCRTQGDFVILLM